MVLGGSTGYSHQAVLTILEFLVPPLLIVSKLFYFFLYQLSTPYLLIVVALVCTSVFQCVVWCLVCLRMCSAPWPTARKFLRVISIMMIISA